MHHDAAVSSESSPYPADPAVVDLNGLIYGTAAHLREEQVAEIHAPGPIRQLAAPLAVAQVVGEALALLRVFLPGAVASVTMPCSFCLHLVRRMHCVT